MAEIQFGVNFHGVASAPEFGRLVRRASGLGLDVFAAPDHLGASGPFTALAAAGAIGSRLRLRTYVLNVGFWNPALLAREVATLDVLSGGRAEVGLGAGHMKSEHDDIVGFAGLRQVRGASLGTFTLVTAAETADRVAEVRQLAGGRPYRSDVLLQQVVVGRNPEDAAGEMARAGRLSVAEILDNPFVLYAEDATRAAEELRRRHALYGFDSVTTHQPSMEALGEVIAAYRNGGR